MKKPCKNNKTKVYTIKAIAAATPLTVQKYYLYGPNRSKVGRPKKEIYHTIEMEGQPAVRVRAKAMLAVYFDRVIPACEATLKKFKEIDANGGDKVKNLKRTRDRLRKVGIIWPQFTWAIIKNFITGTVPSWRRPQRLARALILHSKWREKNYPRQDPILSDRHLRALINQGRH